LRLNVGLGLDNIGLHSKIEAINIAQRITAQTDTGRIHIFIYCSYFQLAQVMKKYRPGCFFGGLKIIFPLESSGEESTIQKMCYSDRPDDYIAPYQALIFIAL